MVHVLVLTTSFPQSEDGSEAAGSFVFDFVQTLATQCRVSVVAPALEAGVDQVNDALQVTRYAVPKLPLSLLNPLVPADWLRIRKTLSAGWQCVRAVAAAQQPDHVFALWALPCGHWARRLKREHNIAYSTWALGSDIWSLGKIPVVRGFLRAALKDSRVNFADGYELANAVQAICGRPCQFLPSTRLLPVTDAPAVRQSPPYTLGFLGRWHPNKGVDILLESLQRLSPAQWADIKTLRIAGGGPMAPAVHAQCNQLIAAGLPVEVSGFLDKPTATRWIQSLDVLMIPSRIESIPVIFSDAMQCDRPVISTPVGDLPRLLQDYQPGVLAETVDAAGFADAITKMLERGPGSFRAGVKQARDVFRLDRCVATFADSAQLKLS